MAQLKRLVSEQLQLPLRQQRVAYGARILSDGQRLEELDADAELQLLLLSSEPCRATVRLRPLLRSETEALWRAEEAVRREHRGL